MRTVREDGREQGLPSQRDGRKKRQRLNVENRFQLSGDQENRELTSKYRHAIMYGPATGVGVEAVGAGGVWCDG